MPIFKCTSSSGHAKLSYYNASGSSVISSKSDDTWSCTKMSLPRRK